MSDSDVFPAHVLRQLVFVTLDGDSMASFVPLAEITVDERPEALARLTERALLAQAALHPQVQELYAAAPTRQMAVLGKPAKGGNRLKIGCAKPI